MKPHYLKQRELFERQAVELLTRLGAVEERNMGDSQDRPWPQLVLATAAGELRLSVHTDLWTLKAKEPWVRSFSVAPWIAGRFADIDAARKVLNIHGELNTYSGKWNHHYWHSWTEDFDYGLQILESRLLMVQKEKVIA